LLAHGTGAIGLPLRLLAREVYDRMVKQKGERACALITGEERIRPEHARYFACTVEAMPQSFGPNEPFDFVAIDEIQLASDPDRGHVFTDRILHARGRHETMLLGADTMRQALQALDLDIDSERRERFSQLSYAGPIKITKLPKRSAVVAFSAEEVYAIAELLKRQRGGCAVIMGALSPRTRNAQVALYQSGEVDYIVATDAIGMGLNLDVQHIAFASRGKFDGRRRRLLRADEAAQIAGRAGRFRDDGTFGETADCEPFDEETIERIVDHRFEPTETLNWRNSSLDWSSIDALLGSLRRPAPDVILRRAPEALDETTLAALAEDQDIRHAMLTSGHVRRLWDICTLPDFRKSGADAHLKLVGAFVEKLIEPTARIKDEWMYEQVNRLDRTEGDLDVLQQRLAAIRTWTYAANRADWLENAETWRGRTREIEDKLSDALHERLMQRFVDRRTSALLKTLNSEEDAPAEVSADGRVLVGGHDIGRLDGLSFVPDATGQTLEGRALRNAALKGLRPVISQRLWTIANAENGALSLGDDGVLMHGGAAIARLKPGADWLSPGVDLIGAPDASPADREAAVAHLTRWLADETSRLLRPVHDLKTALAGSALPGPARGAAYQLSEAGAALDRRHADALGSEDRTALQAIGVKSGRIAAWLPGLLKPAAARLAMTLRSVHAGVPAPPAPSSASFALAGQSWPDAMLQAAGYLRLGPRAVRADMAERLSWLLGQARRGSGTSAFIAPPELAAQIGCPIGEFPDVLRALGLKPAERDAATNAVTRWRFASQKTAQRRNERQRKTATATGPFAALAALELPTPAAPRRRHRGKPPQPKTAIP
jgi:ATP-dependent RNA helicase SUPV3L1/SUV3